MLPTRTTTYPDSLFFPALKEAIDGAQSLIEIASFLFRTGYASETRAEQIAEALKAAAARGVRVIVILNCSRFEPDVAEENYATALDLAAAGCEVRMGPPNQTLHTKMALMDLARVFVGSHNLTRGALSFNRELTVYSPNREMVSRVSRYFRELWNVSKPLAEVPPPDGQGAVEIALLTVTPVGAQIRATFDVNLTTGVDAFAAVAATDGSLAGATMGPSVAPTEREAFVTPAVPEGTELYVAVRAYSAGQAIATSEKFRLVYQPTEPGGEGEGDGDGGGEPPPPEPLTAPTLVSVAWASDTTVTLTWEFVGCTDFQRFVIERENLTQEWQPLGFVYDSAARQWTGSAADTTESTPFRVVVYNLADESAASNELAVPDSPPLLLAPTLQSVTQVGAENITVAWAWTGPEGFHRFEVQQRDSLGDWTVLATSFDPATQEWTGPALSMDPAQTVRVVVFNMSEESQASDELPITLAGPGTLQAPVILHAEIYESGGDLYIVWSWENNSPEPPFDHFLVQQMDGMGTWQTRVTLSDPTTQNWTGAPMPVPFPRHFRVVAVDTMGGEAVSEAVEVGA